MCKCKKVLCLFPVITFLIIHGSFGQQITHFTQYMSNELVINPAYAGAEGALSMTLMHQSQWSGIEGAPTTQSFAAHSLYKSKNIGLGLAIINDKVGIHKALTLNSAYAYRIQLNKETLISFGLQFGFNQLKSDFSSLAGQIQNVNDPKLYSGDLSETNFLFGSGIYLENPRLKLGFSIPNMMRGKIQSDSIDYSILNNQVYFQGRYKIMINENVSLLPGILFMYSRGLPISYDINVATILNDVLLCGLSYRSQESIDLIVQAKLTPQLKIGYSFDYQLAGVSSTGNNSHEFMISYLFSFANKNISSPR